MWDDGGGFYDRTYAKFHFVQYTDDSFTTPVKQPAWLGILGPVLRGVVGDTLRITFLNRTNRVFSMHPHAISADGRECLYMQDTWLVTEDGGVPRAGLPMQIF